MSQAHEGPNSKVLTTWRGTTAMTKMIFHLVLEGQAVTLQLDASILIYLEVQICICYLEQLSGQSLPH